MIFNLKISRDDFLLKISSKIAYQIDHKFENVLQDLRLLWFAIYAVLFVCIIVIKKHSIVFWSRLEYLFLSIQSYPFGMCTDCLLLILRFNFVDQLPVHVYFYTRCPKCVLVLDIGHLNSCNRITIIIESSEFELAGLSHLLTNSSA